MPTFPESPELDPRWQAIVARDDSAAGQFVYGVKTTGVYCHPGSTARLPRPENVEFFDTAAQAEAAGYRPNKRATQHYGALIASACQLIETAEQPPRLNELAQAIGLSPFHFHRVFKATTGLTPSAYARAHRARKLRSHLQQGDSVTQAIYDAGYNSNSRFYEAASQVLGMRPSEYRAGGANTQIRFALAQCSLGGDTGSPERARHLRHHLGR